MGCVMVRRALVAAVMVVAGLAAVGPAADADEALPALSVNDITMQEPPPEAPDGTAVFTVSLDRASDSEVSVYYRAWETSANDHAAGWLTFAPGETALQVPVTVHYDPWWGDDRVNLDILVPSGATIAKSRGVATLVNIDKGGVFSCGGMGARVIIYPVPDGGYDDRIADAGSYWRCEDAAATGESFTTTTPGGKGVKPVTITVTTTAITLDAEEPPPGDTGPFVGDGATARSVPVDVTISEPGGKSIKVEGLWSAVSSHCRTLGADPDLLSTGGATGVVVNGVRMRDVPDVLALGSVGGTVSFGETKRSFNNDPHNYYGRVTRTSLFVSTGSGNVWIGQVTAGYSAHPCQT